MKQTIIAAILTLALLACKKESDAPKEHAKETYSIRVEAKGTDGTVYYSNEAYYANGNGGQANENAYGKIEYAGYSGGKYTINLTNKQACGIDFDLSWLKKDSTVHVPGSSTKTIQLPGAFDSKKKIKAKPLYKCGSSGGDLGWIELDVPESLPAKFKSMRVEDLGDGRLRVIFDVAEVSAINAFNIQLRIAAGEWKTVGVVFPDEVQPNRQYSITVNL